MEEKNIKRIALLGSTGSIGTQCLQVCEAQGFRVEALAAGGNVKLLEELARRWRPRLVAVGDEARYRELKTALADLDLEVVAGIEGVCRAASVSCDAVVNAVVGAAGLRPTLAAIAAGRPLALANKETLVAGGALVMEAARKREVPILPVDSEHSAIFQCLQAGRRRDLRGVILTASGGPFFGMDRERLEKVGVEDALKHPNWEMGSKITIDSATLMNKGLEFIEAMWLFDLRPEQIQVVVHRQSVVHSAVEFHDGSVIAQLGTPDMRLAIQYALTYPAHLPLEARRLSLTEYGALTFEEPDLHAFTCLEVCIKAAQRGGLAPCVANGANEEAVRLFLAGRIPFLAIGELVGAAVACVTPVAPVTLEAIEEADAAARRYVREHAGNSFSPP